jgi:hypothetical protein
MKQQPIEYVTLQVEIQHAMKKLQNFTQKNDFENAREEALLIASNARLLALALGTWTTEPK